MMAIHSVLCLALWASCAAAYSISGYIEGFTTKDIDSTRLSLLNSDTNNVGYTYPSKRGNFTFSNVFEGTYVLALESTTLESPALYKLRVVDDQVGIHHVFTGHSLDDLGASVKYPIPISTRRKELVLPRPAFSLFGLLKTPAVYMSLGTLAMVFAIPTIMGSIDPEVLEEIQQKENQRNEAAGKLSNFDMAKMIADKRTGRSD